MLKLSLNMKKRKYCRKKHGRFLESREKWRKKKQLENKAEVAEKRKEEAVKRKRKLLGVKKKYPGPAESKQCCE